MRLVHLNSHCHIREPGTQWGCSKHLMKERMNEYMKICLTPSPSSKSLLYTVPHPAGPQALEPAHLDLNSGSVTVVVEAA